MRRIKVLTMLAIITLSVMGGSANAQEKGDMAIGANILGGSFSDSKKNADFGVGARFMYNITNPIRLDGSFNYYFGATAPLDFSVNVHYLINVMPRLNVYPLAGLSVYAFGSDDDDDDWMNDDDYSETTLGGLGLNLGAGGEYKITDKIWGNAEIKYNVGMGFAASVGVAYKF